MTTSLSDMTAKKKPDLETLHHVHADDVAHRFEQALRHRAAAAVKSEA